MERLRSILDLLKEVTKDNHRCSSWTLTRPVKTQEIVHFFRTGEKPREREETSTPRKVVNS